MPGKKAESGCSIPVVRVHGVDVDRVRFPALRLCFLPTVRGTVDKDLRFSVARPTQNNTTYGRVVLS